MKMIPEAFQAWCQHLPFLPETEARVATIRSSWPVRRISTNKES